jgi:hypothetical protein
LRISTSEINGYKIQDFRAGGERIERLFRGGRVVERVVMVVMSVLLEV